MGCLGMVEALKNEAEAGVGKQMNWNESIEKAVDFPKGIRRLS